MSVIQIDERSIEISNPDKILFPQDGITKRDLIRYYQSVSEAILPHLKGRPLTLHRFPDGIEGEAFFQKSIPEYFPDWIARASVKKEGGTITHMICENAAALVYLANQACITLHTWLSRIDKPRAPDLLVFDLDPQGEDFSEVASVAKELRELLGELRLRAFVKTTGSRGLHVVVPLDRRQGFGTVRTFARQVAAILEERDPAHRTTQQRKAKRGGRLFIDTGRNSYAQLAVAPYSVRPLPGAPVAAPLEWEELNEPGVHAQTFTLRNMAGRLDKKGDIWADLAAQASNLSTAKERLARLKT
jgi:bifunctional non-homologous end joining protein LigD